MNLLFKNKKYLKGLFVAVLILLTGSIQAQKKKDTLGTEVIRVVKPYTPSVSDAFKIRKEPQIDSLMSIQKTEMDYKINSVPVASTFIPEKGRPKTLLQQPRERFYHNYISVGFGNFMTPSAEIFAHYNLTNYSDFGGFINYQSSFQNMKDVVLNSTYSDLNVDLFYKQTERYFEWKIVSGINNQQRNWYGLSEDISFTRNVINSIHEKQSYGTIYLGGNIEFYDALLHNGEVKFTRFFDQFNSDENHLNIKGNIEIPVRDELINTYVTLEYLNGNFRHNYMRTGSIGHNFFNVGLSPNFTMLRDNLSVNIGARMYMGITDNENDDTKFYIYPNVTASYKISGDNLIAYAGVVGDLYQNSYEDFVSENPFVSPTLNIRRTDQQYKGYIGAKGKLATSFTFNARASYSSEVDKPLFKLNASKTDGTNYIDEDFGYEAGNSFDVVYDEVQTINAFAEVIFDFDESLKMGGNIEFNSYSLKEQEYAWNLPMLKATLLARYKQRKWYANANAFFASDRKDELSILPDDITTGITNSNYFDINIDGGYYFNDTWSVFLRLNNVLNSNYQKYTNFQVQGFQVLGGVTYRFDL